MLELAAGRGPRPEPRGGVSPVGTAGRAIHRFQQVNPPDRRRGLDRDGGVDRALGLAAFEDPELEADAVFRSFLALGRIRVKEVDIAEDDANLLEDEGLEQGI